MIFWRGKGMLVVLAWILGIIINTILFSILQVDTEHNPGFIFNGIFATIFIAMINYFFTKKFISDDVRTLVDEKTGERVQIKDNSSLFFIPNKYWTWIILVLGVVLVINVSTQLS
ncbi:MULTISPECIES: hypothetical protein [unclassified Bacillus (in: firmicutes)]|uniref:hypothetical protein n=1 Tax=unclassified Bacillus (in: firmicutes) TaxID=185979 RepID=UPI0008E888C7|nr:MULTISPECIES: hypothetical protein [unclassified Bacillus (in: firmicutes)]SFK08442.1 hypothetical protein SAMN04488574_1532 [Bacillus sp. 71mf]SFT23351.1 hypothetical protein SAMN04488145_1292 [Bacillus sp. 103mf]